MHGHWLKGYLRDGKEIEGGGGGSGGGSEGNLIVRTSGSNSQADKTFREIAEAMASGRLVLFHPEDGFFPVLVCREDEGWFCHVLSGPALVDGLDRAIDYSLNENANENDYPFFRESGGGGAS